MALSKTRAINLTFDPMSEDLPSLGTLIQR